MFAFVGCYTSSERQGRGTGISLYHVRGEGDWALIETVRAPENTSYLITDRSASTLYAVHDAPIIGRGGAESRWLQFSDQPVPR